MIKHTLALANLLMINRLIDNVDSMEGDISTVITDTEKEAIHAIIRRARRRIKQRIYYESKKR